MAYIAITGSIAVQENKIKLAILYSMKIIDGAALLKVLGLKEENLTPEDVSNALQQIPLMEFVIRAREFGELQEIQLQEIQERPSLWYDLPKSREYIKSDTEFLDLPETQLKRMIKYEKNPMRKQMLQKELSTMNAYSGKHYKGKKHRWY